MKFNYSKLLLVLVFFFLFKSDTFSQVIADFNSPGQSGCAPFVNATFNSTSSGNPTTFTWDFGDGTATGVGNPVSHNYANPGQYTVTLTASDGVTTDSEVKANFITVFKNPDAKYVVSKDTVCSGDPIIFQDSSKIGDGAINQFSWTFNDGNPPVTGISTLSHSFINSTSTVETFTPVLLINDVNGCNSTYDSITIYVYPSPTASLGVGSIGACTFPVTVTFTNNSTGPTIYNWNFGDPASGANNTSTLTAPSHTFSTPGSYLVTLTNGVPACQAQDTMTINLIAPVSAFTADTIVCRRDTVFFINNSTPAAPLTTSQWTFGDGSPSSFLENPTHRYLNSGSYTVTLTTRLGGCSVSSTKTITVPNSPSIAFTSPDHAACDIPFAVTFNADTTSLNVGWQWDFGDPSSGAANSSSSQNPVHTYNGFGSYDVKLIVTDIYGCRDSVTLPNYVQVIAPTINFTLQDSGCVGKTFNYNAVITSPADPVITDYTWDFGDGTPTQTVTTPGTTHQFNAVGIYDVSLTITTQSGCTATLTKQEYARVGTKPDAQIDSILHTICFKQNVSFHDLTPQPVTGWQWFFGDGGGSSEQNPSWQYNIDTSGTVNPFDIQLIAYYNGCPDTDVVVDMVTVNGPIPNFDTLYNCSNPDSVSFVNLSGGADNYSWDFGDASPLSTLTNPSHIYALSGSYDVKLTATNIANGCVVDTTIAVQITNLTAVANSNIITACHPATINFSGTTSNDAAGYSWTFGEGIAGVLDTSAEGDTLHLYNRTGFYIATLTTTDIHLCKKTDTIQVHITGPTAGFSANPSSGCSPINVLFTDTSHTDGGAITQRTWNFGTGGPDVSTTFDTISHPYNTPGLYSVRLTVTDVNGCSDTHTSINYINPSSPDASIIIPDTLGCRNTPELFTGRAGSSGTYTPPVTYSWNFGDSQTFSDTSSLANHIYAANGSYTVNLTVTDANGCTDAAQRNIYIQTTTAQFSVTTNDTCVDVNGIKQALVYATFHSDSNNLVTNWHWDLTVFDKPVWGSPNFFYAYNVPPGSYDASLIITNSYGCNDTSLHPSAIVIPGPSGSFTFAPDSGCAPLTVNFIGTSTNSQLYAWDFGDGSVLNGTPDSIVQHTYNVANYYVPQFYLGFQLSNSFCYIPVATYDTVKVTSVIDVNIIESSLLIPIGSTGQLNVNITDPTGSGPYTYNWNPANEVSGGNGVFTATHSKDDSVYYYLTVPYGNQGCQGFDSVLIFSPPCELNWDSIPNVFSPNADGFNDVYYIKNLCNYDDFKIKIFNRWGKIVFESTEPDFAWNGKTSGGTDLSEGVYYYVLHARKRDWHGYIDLIRTKR